MATFNTICVRVIIGAVVGYLGLIVLIPEPTSNDRKKAHTTGKIISEKYGRFDSQSTASQTHVGKTYVVIPGSFFPTIKFYEITEPQDIHAIEEITKESLQVVGLKKIELIFYEKQIWNDYPNGGGSGGKENVVKEVTIAAQ